MQIACKDLKEGNKVKIDDEQLIVKKIELSNIGKHGRSKCRIEANTLKDQERVIIKLADDLVETF